MPCRKNNNCYWIIPKEPDKAGNVKPPYCHKRGTKMKKTTGDATPPGAAPPAAAEQPAPAPPPEDAPTEPADTPSP